MTKHPKDQPQPAPQDDDARIAEEQNAEVEQLQQQVSDLTEALQRERADATNIRRRHDEQIAGLKNVIKANVVRDLLPVIDNFERALKHSEDLETLQIPEQAESKEKEEYLKLLRSTKKYQSGIQGIVKQFEKTLADMGVTRIKTVGEPFDPKWHEAVAMEDGDGTTEVVSEELQAGYALGDEVIRHAMVRVTMQ